MDASSLIGRRRSWANQLLQSGGEFSAAARFRHGLAEGEKLPIGAIEASHLLRATGLLHLQLQLQQRQGQGQQWQAAAIEQRSAQASLLGGIEQLQREQGGGHQGKEQHHEGTAPRTPALND